MPCCVIAIDRLLSFIYPSLCAKVFSEKMMRLWILVPIVYWIFIMFYNVAGIYNINSHAVYYDPWYGEKNLEWSQEDLFIYKILENTFLCSFLYLALRCCTLIAFLLFPSSESAIALCALWWLLKQKFSGVRIFQIFNEWWDIFAYLCHCLYPYSIPNLTEFLYPPKFFLKSLHNFEKGQ